MSTFTVTTSAVAFTETSTGATFDVTTTGCDRILDFTKGDRIDLSAVDGDTRAGHGGDQGFAFIGTAAFNTSDATIGELRCVYSATSTYIYGDQNGDGRADFMLALTGTTPLAASDFVL